jgi:5-methylcytosine-specific restriction endonuclease McrA
MTAVAKRTSTRLCAEPGCPEVGIDVPGGWRCSEHARAPWDRWRRLNPGRSSGYGARWRRLRDAVIAEHPDCACGAPAIQVHHIDHAAPGSPTFYDWDNLEAVCSRCHRRASRRGRT